MSEMVQFRMTFKVLCRLISVLRYLLLRLIVCIAASFREWYSKWYFLTVRSVPLDWGRIHSNCCHSFIYSNWFLHSWVPALMNDVFWKLSFFSSFSSIHIIKFIKWKYDFINLFLKGTWKETWKKYFSFFKICSLKQNLQHQNKD